MAREGARLRDEQRVTLAFRGLRALSHTYGVDLIEFASFAVGYAVSRDGCDVTVDSLLSRIHHIFFFGSRRFDSRRRLARAGSAD